MSDASPAAVLILAAGAGTRMKSATPKVLHRIAGRSLVHHALAAASEVSPTRTAVVVRHERDLVASHVGEIDASVLIADQDEVPGTGRAVWCGLMALDAATPGGTVEGAVIVTSGDVPLVDGATLRELAEAHRADGNAVTVLTAMVDDPTGYGRVVREAGTGVVIAVVEEADATPEQREIAEINTGLYVFDAAALRKALEALRQDNAQGEMYLTDVIALARDAGGSARAIICEDAASVEGINDRAQLAQAGRRLNDRIVEGWMREGVTVIDPVSTWIDADVILEADVTVLPGTQLLGRTAVASGAIIGPDSTLADVTVGTGARVTRTHASESTIDAGANVGPFSYLRPGTHLFADGKIGAFVETKNAQIGRGSKVPHLSYVGDATIGEYSNIGAATIFVNYDGVTKSRTTVGDHARVGSDNTLIAPVSIGDGAYTGAGSIIRHDVPPGALGINTSPQENVEGWVERRRPGTPSASAAEAARKSMEHDPVAPPRAGDEGEQ